VLTSRWFGFLVLALFTISVTLVEVLRGIRHRPAPVSPNGGAESPAVSAPKFIPVLQVMTGIDIEPGNRVELLLNGDGTYPRLWRDLAAARHAIAMQMYYTMPGRVADTLAAVLCDRTRAGVRVLLVLDAFGSEPANRSWLNALRGCGVELAQVRPLQWYTLHSAANRSHVRAVVIDGHIGYTGGFGIADYWLGDGRHLDQWRETNVRFEGPAVSGLQAAFAAAWAEVTGELLASDAFFPAAASDIAPVGVDAGLLFTAPTGGSTAAERFVTLAIRGARTRLYIANSYFVPDAAFRRLLVAAADRGVDVRVLTVSGRTDVKTPWLAGRHYYDELLARGVRIYEYQPAMMHAKTMVVDGTFATIGSMNFDNRSMVINDESSLVVMNRGFGATMDSVFLDDLRFSKQMTLAERAHRHWWTRLLERSAAVLTKVL
jgi:cardiolipin synthase